MGKSQLIEATIAVLAFLSAAQDNNKTREFLLVNFPSKTSSEFLQQEQLELNLKLNEG